MFGAEFFNTSFIIEIVPNLKQIIKLDCWNVEAHPESNFNSHKASLLSPATTSPVHSSLTIPVRFAHHSYSIWWKLLNHGQETTQLFKKNLAPTTPPRVTSPKRRGVRLLRQLMSPPGSFVRSFFTYLPLKYFAYFVHGGVVRILRSTSHNTTRCWVWVWCLIVFVHRSRSFVTDWLVLVNDNNWRVTKLSF